MILNPFLMPLPQRESGNEIYIFIEQDMPADPFKSIETSIKNLKQLLIQ